MFIEQDLKLLGEVFSLSRVQTVNSQPNNRQALENLMNFEAIIKNKMIEANKALGAEISIPEEKEEEKEVVTDEVFVDEAENEDITREG